MKRALVILDITYDDAEYSHPAMWDWADLIGFEWSDKENIEVVSVIEVKEVA